MNTQLIISIIMAIAAVCGILFGYLSWLNKKRQQLYIEYENHLNLLKEHIKNTSFNLNDKNFIGPDAYMAIYELLYKQAIEKKIRTKEEFKKFYSEFYPQIQSSIGDFFRMCHHIAVFVMGHRYLKKARYYDQFRLILPEAARLLIFYNGIALSNQDFLTSLKQMKIFKNLNYNKLIDPTHLNWYEREYFGEIWIIANKSLKPTVPRDA